ncbi:ribosomal protein L7/L12 [Spirillospora sp. CA-128828]|uniref:ribosomal protein L7/L12 n=1 Tax=Spirillospora sp. CA-128828 TaxID=3240033 RepID=UPI003D8CCCED
MKSSVPYVLPEARERVIELVSRGQYLPAIKLVREATGAGLKEAKEYVDGLKGEAFGRVVPPEVQAKARALIADGRWKDAAKLVRRDTGLGLRASKDYVDAVREGRMPPQPGAVLSDRVRAFKAAGDHESAIALVRAETGMQWDEAQRFVDALR